MSARAVITMSPEQYLAGLKQLEAATAKSSNKMENSFKDYGTSINKAGIAMRYVSSEMGAGAVAFGRAFQVLAGGKIAIAVAAVAGAFTAIKKIWDSLTVSESEYNLKLEKTIELEQAQLERLRKSESEEDATLERLAELAKRQDKTNEEKTEAITLATTLAGKYKDLGIDVDGLTGSYETLLNRMKRINEEQKKQKITSLENIVGAEQARLIAPLKERFAPKWYRTGYSAMTNADDLRLIEQYGTEGALRVANRKMGESATARDEDKINYWSNQVKELNKLLDYENQLNTLRETGVDTLAEQRNNLQKNSEESRRALEAETDALHKQWEERKAIAEQREKDFKATLEHARKTIQAYDEERAAERRANQQRRKDQVESLKVMAMRAQGLTTEAAIEQALYDEAKARGVGVKNLDEKTVSDITDMTLSRLALEKAMQTSTSPELYAPRVDSLIARGGSATPVKMPEVEKIQNKQLDATNKTNQIAQRILNQMDGWNTI